MIRAFLALLSSHSILLLANGLFSTIVALGSQRANFPEALIGFIMAGYFLGMLLSTQFAARFVANIGHIRAFALFASMASTVALGHLLWADALFWAVLRLVSGFCMGGMLVVTEGWLNERASNQNRGRILSIYMIATYASLAISQLFLLVAQVDGFHLFVIVSILYSFALVPILMTQTQAPPPAQPSRPRMKQLYKTSPVGMLGSLSVGVIHGIFYSLAPLYASDMGLSNQQMAIFIALAIASGMLLQIPLGRWSDKIDRRWVMLVSSSMTVMASVILVVADNKTVSHLYLAGVFYGCFAFTLNPLCMAHVNDLSPSNERTQTASGLMLTYGIGAMLGPIIAGLILTMGARHIFIISACVMLIFSLYTLFRLRTTPRTLESKPRFKPFTSQSPTRRLFLGGKKVSRRRFK